MTLSDLQGHSAIAGFFICSFSYSCAAVEKISADIKHFVGPRTVMQHLSALPPLHDLFVCTAKFLLKIVIIVTVYSVFVCNCDYMHLSNCAIIRDCE